MLSHLNGYKTYILVTIGVIVYGLEAVGLIDRSIVDVVEKVVILLGLGTLRNAIK